MKHVLIIVGSDSDLPMLKDLFDFLDKAKISYEVEVVSAHRTPDDLVLYVKYAESLDACAIIAAAGGSAALPGMIASYSAYIPVIGIPINTAKSPNNGMDALYSIGFMPGGISVAMMPINGGKNAAIFATYIVAMRYQEFRPLLVSYKQELDNLVDTKRDKTKAALKPKHQSGFRDFKKELSN